MDAVRTLDHFGASILFANLAGGDRAEMLERIAAVQAAVTACKPGSALVLTELGHAYLDDEVMAAMGKMLVANAPHVKASAVVGLTPKREQWKQLLTGQAGRDIKTFDDVEPAMDWLAEQGR